MLLRRRYRPRLRLLLAQSREVGLDLPGELDGPGGRDRPSDQDGRKNVRQTRPRPRTRFGPRPRVFLQRPRRHCPFVRRRRVGPRRHSRLPLVPAQTRARGRARPAAGKRAAQGRRSRSRRRGAAQGRTNPIQLRGEREDGEVPEPRTEEPHLRPRAVVRRRAVWAAGGDDGSAEQQGRADAALDGPLQAFVGRRRTRRAHRPTVAALRRGEQPL
mmetsp:Transcript_12721/g.44844  ORF Transcript_12721/g.44844 Transcript_12721/m.44844 type:complete len:215 (+) Transcript_12721:1102-1746(+)